MDCELTLFLRKIMNSSQQPEPLEVMQVYVLTRSLVEVEDKHQTNIIRHRWVY